MPNRFPSQSTLRVGRLPGEARKAYKFRLYPTKKQVDKLAWTLRRCKELYNTALQERREAYRMSGVSVSYRMQADQLPALKQLREEYLDIHSQVQQDVLRRLDKAMQAFFRRAMNGEKPGYPRFKSGDRYDSFSYPQGGYELIGNRLHLSKIGAIKIKTCTLKRDGDHWYAIFSSAYEFDPASTFHASQEEIGIDLGVNSCAVLSDGTAIANPRFYRKTEEQIKAAHRKVARRTLHSHRRQRAKRALSRLARKVRHRRRDFLHQAARTLVNRYGVLVFEELNVVTMTKAPAPKQDETMGTYLPNGAAAKGA
jgi:putative transposase